MFSFIWLYLNCTSLASHLAFVISHYMRRANRQENRDTYLLYPLVEDQVSLVNNDCGLHRLPRKSSQWIMSGKSRFLINMSLKVWTGNSYTWAILKMVYVIKHLQNIGYFGLVSVCCSLSPLTVPLRSCFLIRKDIRGQKTSAPMLLTYLHLNHKLWTLRPC